MGARPPASRPAGVTCWHRGNCSLEPDCPPAAVQGKLAKYCHRPAQEPGCPLSAVRSKLAGNGGACSQEPASLPVCREEGVLARVVCLQEQVDPCRVAHRVTCRATV